VFPKIPTLGARGPRYPGLKTALNAKLNDEYDSPTPQCYRNDSNRAAACSSAEAEVRRTPASKVVPLGSMTIIDMRDDPRLFGGGRFLPASPGSAWRVILKALFGLRMTDPREVRLFQRVTGWAEPPEGIIREAWIIAGRRAGKSSVMALVACYLAFFVDWRKSLAPGERPVGMLLAADRDQARVLIDYINGLIDSVPALAKMVVRRTASSIHLANGIAIEIHTSNFRRVRGRTLIFAICDEACFWWSDEASANPDVEVIAAVRPGLVTTRGFLVVGSLPHGPRGAVYETWKRYWGKPGRVLVVKGEPPLQSKHSRRGRRAGPGGGSRPRAG
jgi:hypothetical protein